jgi:hypothetical protein
VIPDAHDRAIYSVSWTKAPALTTAPSSNESATPTTVNKGWIASGGGDGHIKVWQIEVNGMTNMIQRQD